MSGAWHADWPPQHRRAARNSGVISCRSAELHRVPTLSCRARPTSSTIRSPRAMWTCARMRCGETFTVGRRTDAGGAAPRLAVELFRAGQQGHPGAGGLSMLSRVADCVHWMSRYLSGPNTRLAWRRLSGLTLDRSSDTVHRLMGAVGKPADTASPSRRSRTPRRTSGCSRPSRRRRRARKCAPGSEQISTEMWEHLNRLYLRVRRIDRLRAEHYAHVGKRALPGRHRLDDDPHTEGWHYIQIGR